MVALADGSLILVPLDGTGELPSTSSTGQLTIWRESDFLALIDARDNNGNEFPQVSITVALDQSNRATQWPMRLNGKLTTKTKLYVVRWTVQPAGYYCQLLASFQGLKMDAPPSSQVLVGGGIEQNNSFANLAFGLSVKGQGAVAGDYNYVAIQNPVGSGINAVVKSVSIAGGTSIYAAVFKALSDNASTKYLGASKYDGADAQSYLQIGDTANAPPADPMFAVAPNGGTISLPMAEPLIIPPGEALFVYDTAPDLAFPYAAFEWLELPIS